MSNTSKSLITPYSMRGFFPGEGKVAAGWKVKAYSIGDEAYLATNRSRYEIDFRKGTVIVRVKSDSIRLAERFAKYAEGQI